MNVTSTENEALTSLPLSSVAVQVTVVWPTGIWLPLAGTHATVGSGSTTSVAVGGAKVEVGPGRIPGRERLVRRHPDEGRCGRVHDRDIERAGRCSAHRCR